MSVYIGRRTRDGETEVNVDGRALPARLDLANHSPTGFNWGYGGSGPAQLALAILAYEYGDDVAMDYYQDFKWAEVALWGQEWAIGSSQIEAVMERIKQERT